MLSIAEHKHKLSMSQIKHYKEQDVIIYLFIRLGLRLRTVLMTASQDSGNVKKNKNLAP